LEGETQFSVLNFPIPSRTIRGGDGTNAAYARSELNLALRRRVLITRWGRAVGVWAARFDNFERLRRVKAGRAKFQREYSDFTTTNVY
jgi:hypothetical protein